MERYTEKHYTENGHYLICSGTCETLNCGDCGVLDKIVNRLAAYEDTGLAPEEVQQMRWIPVEERLPDKPGHYLVCTNVNYWHGGGMEKNGANSKEGNTDGNAGTTISGLDCL